jgi:hypothetical protein
MEGMRSPAHFRGRDRYCEDKNDLLDVTPIGSDVPIVKRDLVESPLLRLPYEMRDKIWEYTLCAPARSISLQALADTTKWSILRVSRQDLSRDRIAALDTQHGTLLDILNISTSRPARTYAVLSQRLDRKLLAYPIPHCRGGF